MDCSTPGFPVHHQLLELAQTHVCRISDAVQPSHPLLSPSPPAFNLGNIEVKANHFSILALRTPWTVSEFQNVTISYSGHSDTRLVISHYSFLLFTGLVADSVHVSRARLYILPSELSVSVFCPFPNCFLSLESSYSRYMSSVRWVVCKYFLLVYTLYLYLLHMNNSS